MQLRNLIRMMGSAIVAGGTVYVVGPDLLRQHWPVLTVHDACALTNPLAVMVGVGGACFSVSSLTAQIAPWWQLGCQQILRRRQRQHRFSVSIPAIPLPSQSSRVRRDRTSHARAGGNKVNLQQHMTMVEQAIAGAFVNNGLPLHLCGSLQGPHTLTFGLRLYQPTQTNINKALKLSGAIEAAIVDSPARVYMDNGLIYVEVPSPTPVIVKGITLHGQGLAVPLGMTARQTITGLDFATNPHVLLVGPTNRGKTTAARLLAYHLAQQNTPRQARFIVSTFKPKDWQAFGHLAHSLAVITDPWEAEQMITWLVDLMHQRTASGQDAPHLFVFLDDLLNLLGVVDVTKGLKQLASLGRAAGIHLIIGTQRLGETGSGGAAVTGNIPTRLVFGTADAQDAALFSGRGDSGAEKLGRYAGDALLINDGGAYRLAVGYVTDADLSHFQQATRDVRPWARTVRTGSKEGRGQEVFSNGEAHVLEPVQTGSDSRHSTLAGCATDVVTGSKPGSESVLSGPARTDAERQLVLRTYARTGSKTQTCKLVWGWKNGETWAWLNEALMEGA